MWIQKQRLLARDRARVFRALCRLYIFSPFGFLNCPQFAPTNAAFAQIPAATLSALTPEEVVDILTYHVYDGIVTSDELSETTFTMLNGAVASVSLAQSRSAKIGSSNIVTADLLANNG